MKLRTQCMQTKTSSDQYLCTLAFTNYTLSGCPSSSTCDALLEDAFVFLVDAFVFLEDDFAIVDAFLFLANAARPATVLVVSGVDL